MEYWSDLARSLSPYVPGEQPKIQNLIKLNTNENPYPPGPKVHEVLASVKAEQLRLYPDPESSALCRAIADRHGVRQDMVFVGNGSDEVLALCFPAFFDVGRPVCIADITYSFYEVYAQLFSVPMHVLPLNGDFTLPVEEFANSGAGVLLANPNAPTSLAISQQALQQIVQNEQRIAIIDEAYAEFGNASAVPLLAGSKNLLVVKTFSKSHSLAGLRVGYALGHPELIQALNRVKNCFNSYPLDRLAQRCALAAIEEEEYYTKRISQIVGTRERAAAELHAMGFNVLTSDANFLFVSHTERTAAELMQALRSRGILVRYFNQPRINNYLRISIGTDEEMQSLTGALKEILGQLG